MHLVFLCLVLTSLVTGAPWSPPPHHNRFVVKFEEEPNGNTKVTIFQRDVSGSGARGFTGPIGKCSATTIDLSSSLKKKPEDDASSMFQEQVKEVIDESVGELVDPKVDSWGKLWEKVKIVGEKAVKVVPGKAVVKALGAFRIGCITAGTLKDLGLKMEQWDLIDSPKRIGEDIESNASLKFKQGVEEVKETVEMVKETTLHDLLTRSTRKVLTVLVDTIPSVISSCYLLGFSTAFGMGVWFTFFRSLILGKYLHKRQNQMIVNKLYMVYFRSMTYCVGAAFIGYIVSRRRRVFFLCNKMEIFQGFNLLFALVMNLTNLMFLEPRVAKLVVEGKKTKENSGTESVAAEKLKKLNTYSSTLNVSAMVVLTWHLAYIGLLLEA